MVHKQIQDPRVVIEGMEDIIRRDLEKHRALVDRNTKDMQAWTQARSHEIAAKKHYVALLKEGKYNKEAMEASIVQYAINIKHFSDKIDGAREALKFNTHIVDTLTKQLDEQYAGLRALAASRRQETN